MKPATPRCGTVRVASFPRRSRCFAAGPSGEQVKALEALVGDLNLVGSMKGEKEEKKGTATEQLAKMVHGQWMPSGICHRRAIGRPVDVHQKGETIGSFHREELKSWRWDIVMCSHHSKCRGSVVLAKSVVQWRWLALSFCGSMC